MTYISRLGVAIATLALLTVLVIWIGPQINEVLVVDQAPYGDQVPASASIRVTFSRTVDRRSAEGHFTIVPVVPGRFSWVDQTLIFQPQHPLVPETNYRVVIHRGLRDDGGHVNTTEVEWLFRTRRTPSQ